jgi:hypothetical protein
MSFGLFWLAWILLETFRLGLGGMAVAVFTEMTPPPQAERMATVIRERGSERFFMRWQSGSG